MTPLQNLWATVFNFGPAIVLGIYKQWWVGLIALIATFAISLLLTFSISVNLPPRSITVWAWSKPPLVAALVLGAGWYLF